MASSQGNCTSSITTRQARHANLAWSPYIVRTSNIAKNRHKHRFASGTVSKNRHLYRIRCDTFGPALPKHLDQKIRIPGDRRLSTYRQLLSYQCMRIWMIDPLPLQVGERFLNPLRMKHHLRSGNQKKKTRFAGLFFLTGLRPVLPLDVQYS